MKLEQAKKLVQGEYIYHISKTNADGSPMRARVTSVKTWKRDTNRIEVRYKRGLYEYGKLYAEDLENFMTEYIFNN